MSGYNQITFVILYVLSVEACYAILLHFICNALLLSKLTKQFNEYLLLSRFDLMIVLIVEVY